MTDIIIFSKNRPMQLEALLYSVNKFCVNVGQIYCLYKATTDDFTKGYMKIFVEENYSVQFYGETDFKKDLIEILNRINTKNVLLCCDDIVFTKQQDSINQEINLDIFNNHKFWQNTFNFCLGKNITWSNAKQRYQMLPLYTTNGQVIRWRWRDIEDDFGYPNSIGCSLYRTWWLKVMAYILNYNCPNWFEGKLNNKYIKLLTFSVNVSYRTSVVKCIQLNQVQTLYKFQEGTVNTSVEKLNELFLNGYVIDSSDIKNDSNSQFVFETKIIKLEDRK